MLFMPVFMSPSNEVNYLFNIFLSVISDFTSYIDKINNAKEYKI